MKWERNLPFIFLGAKSQRPNENQKSPAQGRAAAARPLEDPCLNGDDRDAPRAQTRDHSAEERKAQKLLPEDKEREDKKDPLSFSHPSSWWPDKRGEFDYVLKPVVVSD